MLAAYNSILLYTASVLLYTASILLYTASVLLYTASVLLYTASVLLCTARHTVMYSLYGLPGVLLYQSIVYYEFVGKCFNELHYSR